MATSTRRQFLRSAGGAAVGAVAVSGFAGVLLSCAAPPTPTPAPTATKAPAPTAVPLKAEAVALPWTYKKIDPVTAAERAYAAYSNGGCMYGAFEGIVGELRQLVGPPFDTFPAQMMKYGGAGVSGWGTLCGALNGAAAAIYLVHLGATGNPVINDVFGWYGATELPDYKPKSPKFDISTSLAESQLCHASVSNWCSKSGFKATSPERAERCAWLTASVVRRTVDLLNQQADKTFKAAWAVPASVTGCLSCHGKGGAKENVHASNQTTCTSCHDIAKHKVPLK